MEQIFVSIFFSEWYLDAKANTKIALFSEWYLDAKGKHKDCPVTGVQTINNMAFLPPIVTY